VVAAQAAPDAFHARFSARGKHYRYCVWNHPVRSPLHAQRWLSWPGKLDLHAMAAAARSFAGRQDFACLQAAGSGVENTVRTLRGCSLGSQAPELVFEVEGDGFLRHMVRNLVGTLLEVGSGRRRAESIGELIASRDRRRAGPTAPAHGLTLVQVDY
jgi:tRNA pseudouridine38-40 synthase